MTATYTEAAFTRQVLQLAKLRGWLVVHYRAARTAKGWRTALSGDRGAPDIILVRGGRVLFVELKSATGRLAPEQERWRAALENCPGVEYYLWRTHDWNRIESVLAWA